MTATVHPVLQFRPDRVVFHRGVHYALIGGVWLRHRRNELPGIFDGLTALPTVLFRDHWSHACDDNACPLASTLRGLSDFPLVDIVTDDED